MIIIVRIGIVIAIVMGLGMGMGIVTADIVMVDIVTGIVVMAMVMGIDMGIIGMEATPTTAVTRDIVVMEEVHGGVDGNCSQHECDIPVV